MINTKSDLEVPRGLNGEASSNNAIISTLRWTQRKRIAVIGAGPKGAALAAKAYVLRERGVANIEVVLFEMRDVACNWDGEHGWTDGDHRLGTPPEKDIGFPYQSQFGTAVNSALFRFSWSNYLVDTQRFANYVDRGKPHPQHRMWADYYRWVLKQIGCQPVFARVTEVAIQPHDGVLISFVRNDCEQQQEHFDGVVFTGPGTPTKIAGSAHDWSESILDGRHFWQRKAVFEEMSHKPGKRVAIVGGGETAASIAVSLLKDAPGLGVDIVNRHGTLYTRGESFHENQLYTDPTRWLSLDEFDRADFIRRTDRGVFSVDSKRTIDQAENIRVIGGNVKAIRQAGKAVEIDVSGEGKTVSYTYDKVIVATGFDPFGAVLELLPAHQRNRLSESGDGMDLRKTVQLGIDFHLRLPFPSDDGNRRSLHVPMLAALSQGPGFPNLSCLGVMSDRVLGAYVPTADDEHGSISFTPARESSSSQPRQSGIPAIS